MEMTPIRPIRSDEDHAAALAEMRILWNCEPDSPEEDRLDVLATLVDAYERVRWPTPAIDPVDAIIAAMDAQGRTRADLNALIGQNRASEILSRKRPLTLAMIRSISEAWRLPATLLVPEYPLVA